MAIGRPRFNTDELYKLVCTHEERQALSMNQAISPKLREDTANPFNFSVEHLQRIVHSKPN